MEQEKKKEKEKNEKDSSIKEQILQFPRCTGKLYPVIYG